MAVVTLGHVVLMVVRNAEAAGWPVADGTIERVATQPKSATVYYSYEVDGPRYDGDRHAFLVGGTVPEREHLLETYPEGVSVEVHFDPNDPANAVLEVRRIEDGWLGSHLFVIAVTSVFSAAAVASAVYQRAKERSAEGGSVR